jgi:hypothetical protein
LAALGAELGVDLPRAVNPPFSPARQAQTI